MGMRLNRLREISVVVAAMAGLMLWTKKVSGPIEAAFLYGTLVAGSVCFAIAELISFLNWLGRRSERSNTSKQADVAGDGASRPEWMGDRAATRRRQAIIIVVLVVLAALVGVFFWMQQ